MADASSSTTAAGSSAEPTGGAEAGKPAKGKAGKSGKPPAAAKGVAGTATAPAADTSDAKATKKAGAGSKGKSARRAPRQKERRHQRPRHDRSLAQPFDWDGTAGGQTNSGSIHQRLVRYIGRGAALRDSEWRGIRYADLSSQRSCSVRNKRVIALCRRIWLPRAVRCASQLCAHGTRQSSIFDVQIRVYVRLVKKMK